MATLSSKTAARRKAWCFSRVFVLLTCLVLSLMTGPTAAEIRWPDLSGVTLTMTSGAVGQELMLAKEGAAEFGKLTGAKVNVLETPDIAQERLGLYLQVLGARSSDIDVYLIDVIWPGIMAEHAVDLKKYIPADEIADHFPAIVANNTVEGKLVGI
ncbi:MAG: hypothetical protein AB1700_06155, partial [Bacillota bacterium]